MSSALPIESGVSLLPVRETLQRRFAADTESEARLFSAENFADPK